ncbi:MAG: hypothetical protein PVI52_10170, partial [Chromatiales bacterium]
MIFMIPQPNQGAITSRPLAWCPIVLLFLMLSFSLFVPALVVAGSGNSFRITGTFATIVRDDLTNQRTEFVHLFEDQKNGKRYRLIDGSAPNSHFRSHDGTFSPNRTPGWKGFDTPDFERLIPIRVITEK